jgi:hypothetical protein
MAGYLEPSEGKDAEVKEEDGGLGDVDCKFVEGLGDVEELSLKSGPKKSWGREVNAIIPSR